MRESKIEFNPEDYKKFFSSLNIPDYSTIKVRLTEDKCLSTAIKFLHKFDTINITENQLEKLGRFLIVIDTANTANTGVARKVINEMAAKKKRKIIRLKKINGTIKNIKRDAIERDVELSFTITEQLKRSTGIELPDTAKRWQGKVKFLGLKNFKTAWYRGIKSPGDVVDTDQAVKSRLKYYFNKAIFQVPQQTFNQIKTNYEKFEPGLYEYLEFIMDKIDKKRRQADEGYSIDRMIFMVTYAMDIESIKPDVNAIAVHTNGHNRPTFKGVPDFMDAQDIEKAKYYTKTNPSIPVAAAPGGAGGGMPIM